MKTTCVSITGRVYAELHDEAERRRVPIARIVEVVVTAGLEDADTAAVPVKPEPALEPLEPDPLDIPDPLDPELVRKFYTGRPVTEVVKAPRLKGNVEVF